MNKRWLINRLTILGLIALLCLAPLFLEGAYWIHVLILTLLNILLAVSLRTIGRTNQFSLGHAGFMAIGAYSSALLVIKLGLSFWISFLLGGLIAALVALAVGYPFLRAKGIYFAILTLLLAEVCRLIAWYWKSLTGGMTGLMNIPSPNAISIWGLTTLTFNTQNNYYYLVLVIVILSLLILYRLEYSRLGLIWGSIKEAESLSQAVGINTMGHKIFIFTVGCFFAGLSGALFAHYIHLLSPGGSAGGKFGIMSSVFIMIYMVVGGEGSFAGPIIGAAVLTIVPELARPLREYQPFIFGTLLIGVVFFMPKGIVGLPYHLLSCYRELVQKGSR